MIYLIINKYFSIIGSSIFLKKSNQLMHKLPFASEVLNRKYFGNTILAYIRHIKMIK